jgi:hypothetical protein
MFFLNLPSNEEFIEDCCCILDAPSSMIKVETRRFYGNDQRATEESEPTDRKMLSFSCSLISQIASFP